MPKFEFVKKVEKAVPTYGAKGSKTVKTGDVVELDGVFADKAKTNPDYKLVEEAGQGE